MSINPSKLQNRIFIAIVANADDYIKRKSIPSTVEKRLGSAKYVSRQLCFASTYGIRRGGTCAAR